MNIDPVFNLRPFIGHAGLSKDERIGHQILLDSSVGLFMLHTIDHVILQKEVGTDANGQYFDFKTLRKVNDHRLNYFKKF